MVTQISWRWNHAFVPVVWRIKQGPLSAEAARVSSHVGNHKGCSTGHKGTTFVSSDVGYKMQHGTQWGCHNRSCMGAAILVNCRACQFSIFVLGAVKGGGCSSSCIYKPLQLKAGAARLKKKKKQPAFIHLQTGMGEKLPGGGKPRRRVWEGGPGPQGGGFLDHVDTLYVVTWWGRSAFALSQHFLLFFQA